MTILQAPCTIKATLKLSLGSTLLHQTIGMSYTHMLFNVVHEARAGRRRLCALHCIGAELRCILHSRSKSSISSNSLSWHRKPELAACRMLSFRSIAPQNLKSAFHFQGSIRFLHACSLCSRSGELGKKRSPLRGLATDDDASCTQEMAV